MLYLMTNLWIVATITASTATTTTTTTTTAITHKSATEGHNHTNYY